jgi:ABC-2 type transport system permease protein
MIAAMPLVGATLRGLLDRRRTWVMVLLAALPVGVALLLRIADARVGAAGILDALMVRTVMPLVAMVFGTAALGSELEDGTAVYLMVKPIARWRIALAKIAVGAGLSVALVVPATVATGLLIGGLKAASVSATLGYGVGVALGACAYAAAFVALSAFTSRALIIGLVYTLVWEGVLAGLLEGTRSLSVAQATVGIANGFAPRSTLPAPLDTITSATILAVVLCGAFLLASWRLARFEVRGGD